MLTRLVIALSVVFLAGAVFASTTDAAVTPPEPRVIKFKVFSEESCPTGVIKVINTPSPRAGDTAVFRTTIEGSIAPTTPVFDKPRWECTITATFEIVDNECSCAALPRVYASV
jgi:hypothetical protein